MVSIVLLTTEEVLQRNSFWHCLDNVWKTEELEPFEEVKPEHLYIKPLSRDTYYAKYPDVPRSESEDENSLSLKGFTTKHGEWKSKIVLKKYIAEKQNSRLSNSDSSLNNKSRRVTSIVESQNELTKKTQQETNDERVREFFKRLLNSCPPPPIEELYDTGVASSGSLLLPNLPYDDFNDVTVPDYEKFEKEKIDQAAEQQNTSPSTSTLKKIDRKVTFKLESDDCDSWYESLYGLSEIDLGDTSLEEFKKNISEASDTDFPSWSDILNECGVGNSIIVTKHNSNLKEEIISQSHSGNNELKLPQDDDDDEIGYARFAIYKIHQSLKLLGEGMPDSSPMRDLGDEHTEDACSKPQINTTFSKDLYRLAPNPADFVEDPVNNVYS